MTAKTPAELAGQAADAVRALNHVALERPGTEGWQYPGDAYSTVANLTALAGYLPQAIGQLDAFIGALEDTGRLRSDKGPGDLPHRLLDFHGAAADAVRQALALRDALDRAHQALGPVGYDDRDEG